MPTREQPEQTYFASCKVRLVVRFEEWAAKDAPAPPKLPPQLRKGHDDRPLEYQRQDGRFLLVQKGSSVQPGGPQGQLSSADDRAFEVEGLIPRQCSVKRNGVREADTATVTIAAADCPFDPRCMRSCAVTIVLGTVTAGDFSLGAQGETHGDLPGADNAAEPLNVVGDTYLGPGGEQRSNVRFQGWVDEWSSEFDDEDEPTVTLECLDNVKLLADQDAPPKLALSSKLPLDEAVADYLTNFPQCAGLEVELRPAGAAPTLASALAKSVYKTDLGPPKDGSSKTSVLDYLSDSAASLGYLLRVEGLAVVLQLPRTLYASGALRPGDPFTGRILPSGRLLQNRTLVYGINVAKMSLRRKFGRSASSNVEVRCYSARQKKTLIARHPAKDGQQSKPLPGGSADQTWKVTVVTGVEDEATLRRIAQGIYELNNRSELQVRVETPNLASWGGGNDDPDLLDLEAGDPVDVEVSGGDFGEEPPATGDEAADLASQASSARAEAYLRRLGYSDALAAAYGRAVGSQAFPVTFRTKTVSIDWDSEEGASVSVELINYVEVRADQGLPEGEEPALSPPTGATPQRVVADST